MKLKYQAKISSQTQFTLEKGDKINYDQVLTADGYQWNLIFKRVKKYIMIKC